MRFCEWWPKGNSFKKFIFESKEVNTFDHPKMISPYHINEETKFLTVKKHNPKLYTSESATLQYHLNG